MPSEISTIYESDALVPLEKADAQKRDQRDIKVHGVIRLNEPMKKYTAWRTGGHVERYFKPVNIDDLCAFLQQIPDDEPLLCLGLGSNLLVRDGGLKGTVIALAGVLNDLYVDDKVKVHVGAGVSCAKVARMSVKHGLSGGEFLAGIPGTVGGALAMNAGAFGGEIWDLVHSVELINRQGRRVQRVASDFKIAYRHVHWSADEWFVATELLMTRDEGMDGQARIRALLKKRAETQPTGQASCGSVFCNPEHDYAARLIEASGLKGASIGHATVSNKHANFIINSGDASAQDIESLIELIQEKVHADHAIKLIPEIRIVGEFKK